MLEHFFGEAFRPHQSSTPTRQGEWVYAQCEEDDLAIKRMCEVGAREEEDQVEEEEEEEEEELDQESGIRAATLSIARRDDKMRWVFGSELGVFLSLLLLRRQGDSLTRDERPQTTFKNPSRRLGSATVHRPHRARNDPRWDVSPTPWVSITITMAAAAVPPTTTSRRSDQRSTGLLLPTTSPPKAGAEDQFRWALSIRTPSLRQPPPPPSRTISTNTVGSLRLPRPPHL